MYAEKEDLEELLSKYLNQNARVEAKLKELELKIDLDNQQKTLYDMLMTESLIYESFIADLRGLLDE